MDEKEKNGPEQLPEPSQSENPTPAEPYHAPYHAPFTPPAEPAPQRRSFVWPMILIFLGVMFLLNNLGLVGWTVWEILWRFWPVWLIAIGIDMLFGRRGRWGGLLALALILTMLGGVFYYASLWTNGAPITWSASEQQAVNQPLGNAREARVEISTTVSRLDLGGGADSAALIQGTVTTIEGERLDPSFRMSGSTAYYELKSQFYGPGIRLGDRGGQGRWSLSLNEQTPIALTVQTGVGRSDIDLSRLNITDLRVSSGVGETNLTLPVRGQFRGKISTGVGQTTIRLPEGVAARIRVQTGIGGVSVRGDFVHNGGYYTTPNYESAADRIDLDVEGGVGGIRIETVR